METFGQRLTRLMAQRDVTAGALERETGIARSYLGYLMQDARRPGRQTLTRLATYFGVSVDVLTGRLDPTQVADPINRVAGKLVDLSADDLAAVEALIDRLTVHPASSLTTSARRDYKPHPKKPGTGELRILGGPEGTRGERAEDTNPEREAL